ncbi:hypothetical protein BD770DRAFT_407819 [Pilaira anomala]|nr:hypothetical protein BD770DRAFT_407819 [Pilaira anomala]
MRDLPEEIYQKIFDYLNKREIKTCLFVCKHWNLLALPIYNKELIIDYHKIIYIKLKLAFGSLEQCLKYGYLVRKLYFNPTKSDGMIFNSYMSPTVSRNAYPKPLSFNQNQFLLLLKYLPNLQEIDLSESDNFMDYISYMPKANLPYLKSIPSTFYRFHDNRHSYIEYIRTCLCFANTLTRLCFNYVDMDFWNNSNLDPLAVLKSFKHLTQLQFHNMSRADITIFGIQEICPNLTELYFTSSHDVLDQIIQKELYKAKNSTPELGRNLRLLNIRLPNLSFTHIDYIIEYLPRHLRKLDIRILNNGLYKWIEEVGIQDALRLMERLGDIQEISFGFAEKTNGGRINNYSNQSKIKKWFQMANAFKGKKKVQTISKFYCISDTLREGFKYNKLNNRITLFYGIEEKDITNREKNIFYSPAKLVPSIGAEIITHLNLSSWSIMRDEEFIHHFLKFGLTECTNLEYFNLSSYLILDRLPRKETNNSNGGTQNNLRMAQFRIEPSTGILEVVSTYLPNIQIIVLEGQELYKLDMDLTRFKKLEYFCLYVNQPFNPMAISFEYIDRSKQNYYLGENSKRVEYRNFDSYEHYYCQQTFAFKCEKTIHFTVCFAPVGKRLNDFDIEKFEGSSIRIPTYIP